MHVKCTRTASSSASLSDPPQHTIAWVTTFQWSVPIVHGNRPRGTRTTTLCNLKTTTSATAYNKRNDKLIPVQRTRTIPNNNNNNSYVTLMTGNKRSTTTWRARPHYYNNSRKTKKPNRNARPPNRIRSWSRHGKLTAVITTHSTDTSRRVFLHAGIYDGRAERISYDVNYGCRFRVVYERMTMWYCCVPARHNMHITGSHNKCNDYENTRDLETRIPVWCTWRDIASVQR